MQHPECFVWWQSDYECGPVVARFDSAAQMLAFLTGWLSRATSRVVDASHRVWQVK
jgi:hypothetical protein